jgi:hypothetical protein
MATTCYYDAPHPQAGDPLPSSGEQRSSRNAPWMPLDDVAAGWAAFGREAATAAATKAASEAFAALAEERRALRSVIKAAQGPTPAFSLWSGPFFKCERALEALSDAAMHWLAAAQEVARHANQYSSNTWDQQHLQDLTKQALEQRLRVWTIAQHLLCEQMGLYQMYYGDQCSCAGTIQKETER